MTDATSAAATQETILVVDDNPGVLHAVAAILEQANYRVLKAPGGPEAIQLALDPAEAIHLLLSDVEMPELSGPDLGRRLRHARPELRVMLMSGGYNGNLLGMNCGWAYIQKPFIAQKLVEMVTEVLQTPGRS